MEDAGLVITILLIRDQDAVVRYVKQWPIAVLATLASLIVAEVNVALVACCSQRTTEQTPSMEVQEIVD